MGGISEILCSGQLISSLGTLGTFRSHGKDYPISHSSSSHTLPRSDIFNINFTLLMSNL